METYWQDMKYGIRRLAAAPAFTTIAVLTLALGIGANLAIFTVVNAVLLRSLPFPNPDRLVRVSVDARGTAGRNIGMSQPELEDLQRRGEVFDDVSAVWPVSASLLGGDRPERIEVLVTSANYFRLLGVQAAVGRVYGPADAVPGFADPVVISDGLWHRQFGASADIVGRKVVMDTDTYTVVGVMPPDFRHPGETLQGDVDMWSACGFAAAPFPPKPQRAQNFIPGAVSRLKTGITLRQAQANLDALAAQFQATYPTIYAPELRWTLRLDPVQENLTASARPILAVLMAAVAFVLIIACVNIANLLLTRSSARVGEISVRRALGASRGRLVQQLLCESLLLSTAGSVSAVLLIVWLRNWLIRMIPADLPRVTEVHFDWQIAGTALILAIVTGLSFGLLPALQVSGLDKAKHMAEAGRSRSTSIRQKRFRNVLVTAEIALSLLILIGTGLLLRSFREMLRVNPGFNPVGLGFAQIWIPVPNNPSKDPYGSVSRRNAFVSEVLRRVETLPGVQVAAMGNINQVPFGGTGVTSRFVFAGESDAPSMIKRSEFRVVSSAYFNVLQSPLISGRAFTDLDTDKAEKVVIVNQAFVRNFSSGIDLIGKSLSLLAKDQIYKIVGIVGDIHDDGLDAPVLPRIYFSSYQRPGKALALFFRMTGEPGRLDRAVEETIHAIDPTLPVFGQTTMQHLINTSETRRKFTLALMSGFALTALLLATLGIYGVVSYSASQRFNEIGVRMAIGARQPDIVYLILGPGLRLAIVGVAIGTTTALMLTRFMRSLLFIVSPTDGLTYTSLSLLIIAVSTIACFIPARRAARLDPLVALRHE